MTEHEFYKGYRNTRTVHLLDYIKRDGRMLMLCWVEFGPGKAGPAEFEANDKVCPKCLARVGK